MIILLEIIGGAILLLILFGPAWLAGRAVARGWNPWWHSALWMVPYAAGLRFLRYALFDNELLSVEGYAGTLAAAIVVAALGHRLTRTGQMVGQYPWLYERSSPLTWRRRGDARAASPAT